MAYLSTREAAALLGVSRQTVRSLIRKGKLSALRVGAQLRVRADSLDELAEAPKLPP